MPGSAPVTSVTWHNILYAVLFFSVVPYSVVRGGAPERVGALIWFGNNLVSAVALVLSRAMFQREEWWVLGVDAITLAAFGSLALAALRHWPLFACGMQLGGVVVHLLRLIRPDMLALGYAYGQSIWSYPILFSLWAGTMRHRRRQRRYGRDPSWSPFFVSWIRNEHQIGATDC